MKPPVSVPAKQGEKMPRRSSTATTVEDTMTDTVETVETETSDIDVETEDLDTEVDSDSEVVETFAAVPRKPYVSRVEKGYFKNTQAERLKVIRDTLTSNPSASGNDLVAAIVAAGLQAPSNCATEFAQVKKEMGIGRVKRSSGSSVDRNSTVLPARVNTALLKFAETLKAQSTKGVRIFDHNVVQIDVSGDVPVLKIVRA